MKNIKGVILKQVKKYCDDRGFLAEVIKKGESTFVDVQQTTVTETFPGTIKAFHYHKKQTDVWFVARGMAQVVLFDLREKSETYKETNVFYLGENNPLLILIPPMVAHGYRVLGNKSVLLFYHADQLYDPKNPDEKRIDFDSPTIGFNWNTRNR